MALKACFLIIMSFPVLSSSFISQRYEELVGNMSIHSVQGHALLVLLSTASTGHETLAPCNLLPPYYKRTDTKGNADAKKLQ